MNRFVPLLLLLTLLILPGCELFGDEDDPETVTTGVVVANQGNFSDGNGSVTVYDPDTETAATLLADIGSIIQSVHLASDELYVMANTGARVDVVDVESGARTAQIEGFVSPRYMAVSPASGKGYVTNLFKANFAGGLVHVVDTETLAIVDSIDVGDNPEGLVAVGQRLFVGNHGFGSGTTVSIINTLTDEVVNTVDVECDGPRTLLADSDDEVFVFCTGRTLFDDDFNVIGETDGAIRVLDGSTGAIVERIEIDGRLGSSGPGQDAYHAGEVREMYVVQNQNVVLRFDTRTNSLVATLDFSDDPIGALAYDARSQRLYLGRVAGFTESGSVTIHDRTGTQVGTFVAGIAPTFITFITDER